MSANAVRVIDPATQRAVRAVMARMREADKRRAEGNNAASCGDETTGGAR